MEDKIELLLQSIEELYAEENSPGLTGEKYESLSAYIPDDTTLANALPCLKAVLSDYNEKIDKCSDRVRLDSDSKKMWKTRADQLTDFVGYILMKLGHKSYTSGDAKATVQRREVLEISDEESLLSEYINSAEYALLKGMLPGWVKVTMTIDKTALRSHVKADSTLLCEHPEWIHTKESISANLK